jgi:hypothetical protein
MNQTCKTWPEEENIFTDAVPVADETYLCGCIDNYDLTHWDDRCTAVTGLAEAGVHTKKK